MIAYGIGYSYNLKLNHTISPDFFQYPILKQSYGSGKYIRKVNRLTYLIAELYLGLHV